jgi:lysozyme
MQLSQSYSTILEKLEGIKGQVPGNPGHFSWYYDNIGVATLAYGHALTDLDGGHIRRGELNANARADAAVKRLFPGGITISLAQALQLKTQDMGVFVNAVNPLIHTDTKQPEFDALVDFSYNVGIGALKSSTLLRFHNEGTALGPTGDLAALAHASKNHLPITTIGEAFAAWSNEDHTWSKGVFHRRMFEFLIYAGMEYATAYSTAFDFQG